MTLRHLETFVAVADCGSFHAAAERLGITQSAVSMQMKALENELRAGLFDRSTRPPVLNPLGAALLDRARDIVLRYRALQTAAADSGEVLGSLRLGVVPSASVSLLPGALAQLGRRHPSLQIRIESGLSADLLRRVTQGILDAAVVTEPTRLDGTLAFRQILSEPLLVVAPLDAAGSDEDTLLTSLPFIRFNRRTGVGLIIEAALRARRLQVQESMDLDSLEAILLMVANGLGAAVVPRGCMTDSLRKRLYSVPFGTPPVERSLGLVTKRDNGDAVSVQALFDALCRQATPQGKAVAN